MLHGLQEDKQILVQSQQKRTDHVKESQPQFHLIVCAHVSIEPVKFFGTS